MNDFTIGVLVGAFAVLVLAAIALYGLRTRDRRGQKRTIDALEAQVVELRQERTEDKEINRRLRRDLAASSPRQASAAVSPSEPEPEPEPKSAQDSEPAAGADLEDVAATKRELAEVQARCRQLEAEVVDRDQKLTRYRESLREIREALELRDATEAVQGS